MNRTTGLLKEWKHQADSLKKWGLPGGAGSTLQDYVIAKINNDPSAQQMEDKIYANESDLMNRLFIEATRIAYKE